MALVTGGAGMERSGTGLNWRSQAPKQADVSLEASSGDSSAGMDSRWGPNLNAGKRRRFCRASWNPLPLRPQPRAHTIPNRLDA